MKILLVGINAKYIHSNLAVYSLRAFAMDLLTLKNHFADCNDIVDYNKVIIEIAEFTINQSVEKMIQSIYKAQPDWIGFSCYIWNVEMVQKIAAELHKLLSHVPVWLGGPEVSFDLQWQMRRFPDVTGIMYGEGERTFSELIRIYSENKNGVCFKNIKGIVYRDLQGRIVINEPAEIMDLDDLPFPYDDIEDFQNRIIYYESSRGCPYSCAYCLSSVEKQLRFRSLDKVYAELQQFLDAKVRQVKFVDRTFNCSHARAMGILQYIKEHDNGVTNFHFEVAGDLLKEEELTLIGSLRPGLIQLEIGVQSVNEKTLKAIRRKTDFDLLKNNIGALLKNGNVHLHLDLIAGLPFENIDSFIRSFNEVYQFGGHELQLGFLKVLHGTPMMRMKEEHDIVCTDFPPYEVLRTKELSYEDILRLKAVEEMLEIYHNSGQFRMTERYLMPLFSSPFDFYERLAAYYERRNYPVICSARERRYIILLEYLEEYLESADGGCLRKWNIDPEAANSFMRGERENKGEILETVREFLTVDYYLRERAKARPSFAPDVKKQYRKAEGQMHLEELQKASVIPDVPLPQIILFDYAKRDPVTKEAKITAHLQE